MSMSYSSTEYDMIMSYSSTGSLLVTSQTMVVSLTVTSQKRKNVFNISYKSLKYTICYLRNKVILARKVDKLFKYKVYQSSQISKKFFKSTLKNLKYLYYTTGILHNIMTEYSKLFQI